MATTTATKTAPFTTAEWKTLKSLEKIIHQWNEDECNGAIQWEDSKEETPRRYYLDNYGSYTKKGPVIVDKENQALESARKIAGKYGLSIYHQLDPRGCSLYVYNAAEAKGRIRELYSSIAKPVI